MPCSGRAELKSKHVSNGKQLCHLSCFQELLYSEAVHLVWPKPKISRITRSLTLDANSQKFQIRKCKTSTYQQTYTIRITRIWNILPRPITNKFNSLTIFKKLLLQYYHTALEFNYNVDDPRSWKTICRKCNQARDLTKPITCCF